MRNPLKRICMLFIVLAALYITFAFLLPVRRQMNETITCYVLDQENENNNEKVHVTFTGSYSDYLIRKDIFTGRIAFEGYDFIDPNASDCQFTIGEYTENMIWEYIPAPDGPSTSHMGMLYAIEDFESLIMVLMVPTVNESNSKQSRYILTYPEMNSQENYSILNKNNA